MVTTTHNQKECVFAIYDEKGILKCGIEKAHYSGDSDFIKPISCHLYPIRVTRLKDGVGLNFHRWDICDAACALGDKLKMPVFKFLEGP